jgi:ATP-dependent helicase/nuclease subunit A
MPPELGTPGTTGGGDEPTDEQWEAIRATDEHVLVSASAGTGKTYTVVKKILYLLGVTVRGKTCASPIDLDDIAAITFTNKAAAELKSKLRGALRGAGRRADAYRIDGARIGTIHTFCANILREFALRTGRAPSLQLVEEGESILLRGEAVRDALLEALEDERIPGLDSVVAEYSVEKIESYVRRLLDQGGQLETLIARAPDHEPRERALLQLAELAQRTLIDRLEDASRVDFDRMITWARDLIRDDATVRRTLQRRIRVLFIDEFQDVDPVQREIAYLLAQPDQSLPTTTRLALVGDAKQSIYRFRNADVTLWRSVERDFAESGWKGTRVVPLLANRRSVAPILAFVDQTVGSLLDRPTTEGGALQDFEVPYASMTPVRSELPFPKPIEIVTVPAQADGKMRPAEEVRRIEAAALANRAVELHEKSGVAWRDMAVLLCGWGAAETFDAALRSRGVPTYILRDEGFYSRLEVTDVLIALEAIRNPSDDRVLFGFLRSPFVGLQDESLLRIARQCGSPCWPDIDRVNLGDARERELLARGVALLRHLGAVRDRIPTAELIETLLAESGYLAHLELLGHEGGGQRIANLQKLARIARSMAEESVGDFLDMVARQREVEAREGEAQLYGPNEDVVTITSVHCAKGLDWRVVFWSDLIRTPRKVAKKDLLIARDRVMLPELEDDPTPEFTNYADLLNAEQRAESKRLWYVAATRAKDLLILPGVPLGSGNRIVDSPAHALLEVFPDLTGKSVEYSASSGARFTAVVRMADASVIDDDGEVEELPPIGDPASLATPFEPLTVPIGRRRHSATELLSLSRCPQRHWFRYVAGLREPPISRTGSKEHSSAIRRGLVVHDVLENYDEDVELGILLESAIGRWDPDAPPPEATRGAAYRRRLAGNIETILANEQYRSVFDRADARRELGFAYVRSGGESLEGKIDLVAPSAGGYDIVDVKTSECDADVAAIKARQYAPQRAAYSRAVEAISGRAVESFAFQFAGEGAHVGRATTDGDRAEDERRVDDLIQLARRGARDLTSFPAECEFCGYREAGWCAGVQPESREQ